MPTRLRRPSLARRLAITAGLIGLQVYFVYSAFGGNYGIEAQERMAAERTEMTAVEAAIDSEIAQYREQIALLDPMRLDPDLLTERARALLGIANPRDVIVPLNDN